MNKSTPAYLDFIEISDLISSQEFEEIKHFVLKKGDRLTYRNFDNLNPHYAFKHFDVFLGADVGQKNSSNDPTLSDFNQLVIRDNQAEIMYYELIIVREGDVSLHKNWLQEGMQEGQLYLIRHSTNELEKMKKDLPEYLEEIRKEIKNNR